MKNTEVQPKTSGLVRNRLVEAGTTSVPGEGETPSLPG